MKHDDVFQRCTVCGANPGFCNCWTHCARCGWSLRNGEQCRNPVHEIASGATSDILRYIDTVYPAMWQSVHGMARVCLRSYIISTIERSALVASSIQPQKQEREVIEK